MKFTKETVDIFCSLTKEQIELGMGMAHDSNLLNSKLYDSLDDDSKKAYFIVMDTRFLDLAYLWIECGEDFFKLKLTVEYE